MTPDHLEGLRNGDCHDAGHEGRDEGGIRVQPLREDGVLQEPEGVVVEEGVEGLAGQ